MSALDTTLKITCTAGVAVISGGIGFGVGESVAGELLSSQIANAIRSLIPQRLRDPNHDLTRAFHAALRGACDNADPQYWPRFKAWCDEYFYLPHRNEPRGVGGIFFDDLASADAEADFAFVQSVGLAFLDVYPAIVRRRLGEPWTAEQKRAQLIKRGRYVEFNLLWDRGTRFGIETGGNPEAVLMSLPPEVAWP